MISAVAGAAADLLASLVGGCPATAASAACASAAAAAAASASADLHRRSSCRCSRSSRFVPDSGLYRRNRPCTSAYSSAPEASRSR